jgi:hypothetical protein
VLRVASAAATNIRVEDKDIKLHAILELKEPYLAEAM